MIVIPSHIKGLIFDLDGTLADTMPIHLESWVEVGRELQVPITKELINQHLGTPTLDLAHIFNEKFGWGLIPNEVAELKKKHFNQIKERDGKIKPIQHIYTIAKDNRSKLPMSIGTGSSRHNAISSLEDLDALDWWVTIITGSDDILGKPNPDIFLACAEAMQVEPTNCLVFEDGPAGISAAKAAGMEWIDITKVLQ